METVSQERVCLTQNNPAGWRSMWRTVPRRFKTVQKCDADDLVESFRQHDIWSMVGGSGGRETNGFEAEAE